MFSHVRTRAAAMSRLSRLLQGLFTSARATRAWEPRPDLLFHATRAAFGRPSPDEPSHSAG
jgi:hypothetical protein